MWLREFVLGDTISGSDAVATNFKKNTKMFFFKILIAES